MPESAGSGRSEGCLVCQGVGPRPWPAATRLVNSVFTGEVVRCCRCGFCWMSPIPEPGSAAYEAEYFDAYAEAGQPMPASAARSSHLDARLTALERLVPDRGPILDVGVGDGTFLRMAQARGWPVVGADVSRDAAAQVRRALGIEVIEGPLERVALPLAQFSAVHLSHVIEHTTDLVAALQNVRRSLRPGGITVIEVPNELRNAVTRGQLALGVARPYDVRSTHVYFFDPVTLPRLLEAEGFSVRSVRTFRNTAVGGAVGRALRVLAQGVEQQTTGSAMIEVFAARRG